MVAPSVADVFENNDIKTAARVDDSQVIEYGVLASEAGQALFQAIRDIAAFNAGPSGPIAGTLTQAQRDFLTGQIQAVITAHEGINLETAKNGLKQNEVDTALERHETSKIVIKSFISDIEDVDLAEAVSRLNRTQVAAQASARVLSEVNQLTLLNFL
jgi:flagellar hook-associated protein 3 FlgL